MRITIDTNQDTRTTTSPLEADTWIEEYRHTEATTGHRVEATVTVWANEPFTQTIQVDGDSWDDITLDHLYDEWANEDDVTDAATAVPALPAVA